MCREKRTPFSIYMRWFVTTRIIDLFARITSISVTTHYVMEICIFAMKTFCWGFFFFGKSLFFSIFLLSLLPHFLTYKKSACHYYWMTLWYEWKKSIFRFAQLIILLELNYYYMNFYVEVNDRDISIKTAHKNFFYH